ncbi:MAG TPA: hemerythrin domain-containing protein [Alphaproteobacteria bacterium]|nr:hemerythrin domain-containing protein [Alphaproteobacteria bacterium]
MPEVLRQLGREHADIAKLLALLNRQLAIFSSGKRPDYDLVRKVIDYFLDYPDAVHHPKEDLIYRELAERDEALAAAIGDIEREHEQLAAKVRELAEILREILAEELIDRARVRDLTDDFARTYRNHMRREEEEIFPAAEKTLTGEAWARIDAHAEDRDDPLFGSRVAEHYRRLRDEIEGLAEVNEGA